MATEPMNLCEWRAATAMPRMGRLFTCGRPGRATLGRNKTRVAEDVIDLWVKGLPKTEVLQIVSLLGKKTTGLSEFGYYPFRSSKESGIQPTFQEWLDERYGHRFIVHEFPTTDARGIPPHVLIAVTQHILSLIEKGSLVLLVDSAGAERTARVCEEIGYKRKS
jgi:hypothetical protein